MRLLPVSSFPDEIQRVFTYPSFILSGLGLRDAAEVLAAEAGRAAEAGDLDAFLRVEEIADRCLRLYLSQDEVNSVFNLIVEVILQATSAALQRGAETLGLDERAAAWEEIDERLVDRNEQRTNPRTRLVSDEEFQRHAADWLRHSGIWMLSHYTTDPPPFTLDDLRPLRTMERAAYASFLSLGLWLVLVLVTLAIMIGARARHAAPERFLGLRLQQLLRWSDQVWIFALGLLAPLALVSALARLGQGGEPPLRAWFAEGYLMPAPWAVLAALIPLWTAAAAGWRLRRRARPLFLPRGQKETLLVVSSVLIGGLAALAYLLIERRPDDMVRWTSIGLLCASLPALLLPAALALIGGGPRSILRVAICRACLPALATALLLSACAVPAFLERSNRAFLSEQQFRSDPEQAATHRYEYQLIHQHLLELREIYHGPPD